MNNSDNDVTAGDTIQELTLQVYSTSVCLFRKLLSLSYAICREKVQTLEQIGATSVYCEVKMCLQCTECAKNPGLR